MEKQSQEQFYKSEHDTHQLEVKSFRKQLLMLSFLRLAVFLVTALGVFFTYTNWRIAVSIGVVGVLVFLVMLSRYTDLKKKQKISKALVKINKEELEIGKGNFRNRFNGKKFLDPAHYFSLDIDLFGVGSFFQFINRTVTKEGTKTLVRNLLANNITEIELRQETIKELSAIPKWRQKYSAVGSLIHVDTPTKSILSWLKDYQFFLPKFMAVFPHLFSAASVVLFGLVIAQVITPQFLGYWLLVGLLITGVYLKKINHLAGGTDKVKDIFRQYAGLLELIETESFKAKLLREKQSRIQSEDVKASIIFSKFSKHLDALDNRNNMIAAIFANGLFLTDIKNSYKVERWIKQYRETVTHWFEVVAFFDAYNTLGTFAFNHSNFTFPKIEESHNCIQAINLGHPLLDASKRVSSDLNINNQEFFIVTGANMAGKSTFLRTVSLHIVMANIGLPVCAVSSVYSPVKLITSMRTTDSLTDDSSYFFSELTRLKFIVDEIKKEPYFIILDEILKGTNSTDKAIGSRKFVEKLVSGHATGIIATHDLSLCEISKELTEVKNYFFDAQIINDELFFDYKFKSGICQNMNASFLLKKMDIV